MAELFMKWRPDFNLGIDIVDQQHKKIINLINILSEAYRNSESRDRLSFILKEMEDYSDYHFKTEESIFTGCNYPFSEEHIRIHENFRKKVARFKEQSSQGYQITPKVLDFLRTWFTNHILDVDREYVDIVRSVKNTKSEIV